MSEKELLLAIRDELRSRLASGVYKSLSVFIARSRDSFPPGATMPAIGIKDSDETVEELPCNVDRVTQNIDIVLWASESSTYDGKILGDSTQPGVLDMQDDIEKILRYNRLGGIVDRLRCTSALGSEDLKNSDSDRTMQRKVLVFTGEVNVMWER